MTMKAVIDLANPKTDATRLYYEFKRVHNGTTNHLLTRNKFMKRYLKNWLFWDLQFSLYDTKLLTDRLLEAWSKSGLIRKSRSVQDRYGYRR